MALQHLGLAVGKDILKTAFPHLYGKIDKYHTAVAGKNRTIKRNSTGPKEKKAKEGSTAKALQELSQKVADTNEISTDILETLLIQNTLIEKLAASGLGGGKHHDGIIDTVLNTVLGVMGASSLAALAKKVVSRVRGKSVAKAVDSASGEARAAEEVAIDAAKGASKLGKVGAAASKVLRVGGKLMRVTPLLGGAIDGYDEYESSGNAAKAGAVGVGGAGGAWAGAAAGAAIGTLILPGIGTALGGMAGGMLGGWGGATAGGAAYDALTKPSISSNLTNVEATLLAFKADNISFKAKDLIISAMEIKGLNSGYGGGGASGYEGGAKSVWNSGGSDIAMPTFRRGVGGSPTGGGGGRGPRNGSGADPSYSPGGVGPSATAGSVPGRPDLKGQDLTGALPAGKERFFHASGNVQGVDNRLIETLRAASKDLPPGYRMEMISGHDSRGTGTKNHPNGVATDVKIYDASGKLIPHSGNSPGWKYYEQMYKSVQVRGKAMYPGTDWIWGGSWVGSASGPGDPMHYQIRSNIPGVSPGNGMYDPNTGFDKNSGVNQGINFKANAMSHDERDSYVDKVKKSMQDEQKAQPAATPSKDVPQVVQPQPVKTESITPAATQATPPVAEPVKAPPGPESYKVNMPGLVKKIKEVNMGASLMSDAYIEKRIRDGVPRSVKFEGNTLTGSHDDLEKIRSGFKDNDIDVGPYIKPVETAPKAPPAPAPPKVDRDKERVVQERDSLKKKVDKMKKEVKEHEDLKEEEKHPDKQEHSQERSDKALMNINPQLHKDEHPQ